MSQEHFVIIHRDSSGNDVHNTHATGIFCFGSWHWQRQIGFQFWLLHWPCLCAVHAWKICSTLASRQNNSILSLTCSQINLCVHARCHPTNLGLLLLCYEQRLICFHNSVLITLAFWKGLGIWVILMDLLQIKRLWASGKSLGYWLKLLSF